MEDLIRSFRPDLKNWCHQKQWKPLANYSAFLALFGFPRLAPNQKDVMFRSYNSVCGAQKAIVYIPHLNEKCWLGGTVLGRPAACQGRDIPWFPCPPIWSFSGWPLQRDLEICPRKSAGVGWGGVGFVYSDFKSGNTPGILFIVPLKLVLYLVNYTSIKIGWKSSSWSNKSLRIINMQIPQCPAWPPSYEIRCILVFILQIAIIATSKRKGNFFYTKFQTQLPFNKKLHWRINSTSWMMSVFSVWITSY